MNDDNNSFRHVSQTQEQSKVKKNGAYETLWDGSLKVDIFRNELKHGVSFNLRPGRLYTDSEGKTRETNTYSRTQALRMTKLMDKGTDRVNDLQQQMKSQNRSNERRR